MLESGEVSSVLSYAAFSNSWPIVNSLLHAGAFPFLLRSTRDHISTKAVKGANELLAKKLHDCYAVYIIQNLCHLLVSVTTAANDHGEEGRSTSRSSCKSSSW